MSNLLRMIPIFVYFNGENVCGGKVSLNKKILKQHMLYRKSCDGRFEFVCDIFI